MSERAQDELLTELMGSTLILTFQGIAHSISSSRASTSGPERAFIFAERLRGMRQDLDCVCVPRNPRRKIIKAQQSMGGCKWRLAKLSLGTSVAGMSKYAVVTLPVLAIFSLP